jgi:hypothetical protein
MRVFKTKWFTRHAAKEGIDDAKLSEAVRQIENGLIDADYGGGMIKQRIARDGEGKSSGYRSIIAFKSDTRSIFFYFFPKNKKDNLLKNEVKEYREATAIYLSLTDAQITLALEKQELVEVNYNDKEI